MAKSVTGSTVSRKTNGYTGDNAYQMRLVIKDTGAVNSDKTKRQVTVTLQGLATNPGGYELMGSPYAWIANSSGTRLSSKANIKNWWPRGSWITLATYTTYVSPGNNTFRGYYDSDSDTSYMPIDGTWYASATLNVDLIPLEPNKPASITIPNSAAPDQKISVSWSAATGGTVGVGVSGYRLAYSKDGGSNYTNIDVGKVTSYQLDLNALGYKHGDNFKVGVQAYSTVSGTKYYGSWVYSGTLTTNFIAPSAPSTITIPSSIAPDKTASISWSAASGGTNGVKGYEWQWSNDEGNTWPGSTQTTEITGTLDLNKNGFVHGSKFLARVRAYTIGHDTKYYSDWKTSSTTTTSFIAPSKPQAVAITTDMAEPIPTGTYKGNWTAPSTTGSNGVSGYRIQWLKNGVNLGSEYDITNPSASKAVTESDVQPGDILSYKVRAYTIGQNVRYYSDYTSSGTITIVSDKFIYLSQNGGNFTKYKAFISLNGAGFIEIKKEKLRVIK